MSRKLKVLFTVSVLLNLLLVGGVIGFGLRWQFGDYQRFAPIAMRKDAFHRILEDIEDIEDDDGEEDMPMRRADFQARFATLVDQNRDLSQSIFQKRRQIRTLLEQEPFDHGAYQEALAAIIDAKGQIELSYAVLLGDIARAMPRDRRRKVLRWLYAHPGGKGYGKGHRHD